MTIPDEELGWMTAELDDCGIAPDDSLWIRVERIAREYRMLKSTDAAKDETIATLNSRIAKLESRLNGDPCIGQMRLIDVDGDIRTYRCSKCHATQTSFGTAPTTCGARL